MINEKNRQSILRKERENAEKLARKLNKDNVPSFSYGLDDLDLKEVGNEKDTLKKFVSNWFENPDLFLNYKNFDKQVVIKNGRRFSFPSIVDQNDTAHFYHSKQPFWGRGAKMAFIIAPHWSPLFWKYYLGTAIIRNFFLPAASYMYFPKFGSSSHNLNEAHYEVVGPNLGLTIKRFQQDVLNIQSFSAYLKKELGYEYIGIWGYSIGSLRAFVASMFSDVFDYVIMHFLADSFPEATLTGVSTSGISEEIRKHVSDEDMEELWSPMSPGRYVEYFDKLPNHVRLIQPKYDLVFGEENNKRMVNKIQKYAPNVVIEYGDFGHSTYGWGKQLIPSIYKNAQFVIKNSPLRVF